jgi:DNA-binding LacI/PurR family transcriptional regulator
MVYGDRRGCVNIPQRRGESHVEGLLHRWYQHTTTGPGRSDITGQLDYVATHYRHTMLIIVVSDEPDVDDRLGEVLTRLTGRHDIMWAMVSDMPAVGPDNTDGYDVATGHFVLNGTDLGHRVVTAYRRAEQKRRDRLDAFLTAHAIAHATIAGSKDIRRELVRLTEVTARVG